MIVRKQIMNFRNEETEGDGKLKFLIGLHRIVNLPDIRPPDIRWFFLPDTGYPAGYPAKISGHRISGNGRISG